MENCIKFRILVDKLSANEFIRFLSPVGSISGLRPTIIKALFNVLRGLTESPEQITAINQIMVSMIRSRNGTEHGTDGTNLTFTRLPAIDA